MTGERGRNDSDASWRPRDRRQTIDHDREQEHLDSEYRDYVTHASEVARKERYVSRDYYQTGEGYNPIGSTYLRDIGVGAEDEQSRRDEEQGWSKSPWRQG